MLRSLSSSLLLAIPLVIAAAACEGPAEGEGEGDGGEGEGPVGEGEGEGEAGEGEGEGPAEGEGEGPPPPPPNDSCATAEPLASGVTKRGTTAGAADDSACPAEVDLGGGGDVAYTFTLDEESGIRLTVASDVDESGLFLLDHIVSLFDDAGCGAGSVEPDERTCVNNASFFDFEGESLVIGSLPAGTYFLVVDTVDFPGGFEIDFEISEPFCVGDIADEFVRFLGDEEVTGNETPESAVALNGDGTIGSISRNSDTSTPEQYDVLLCEGDVDYYLVGHLGGLLTLNVTGGEGFVAELFDADVDVEASEEAGDIVYTEGALVAGVPGTDVDVPAGLYLLKVTENQTLVGAQNIVYDVAVTHQCEADDFDVPVAALDTFFESQQDPVTLPLEAPVERTICGADVDLILIDVLFDGSLGIVFSGDVGRDVTVELVSVDDEGAETPIVAARSDDEANNTLTVSADVAPGRVLARVSGPGIANTGAYTWSVILPGLDGAPENDACADAEVLVPGVQVGGRTVGAENDFTAGTCNFEDEAFPAVDSFYRFTLDAETATQLELTRLVDYSGTLGLFRLPATGCPADLTTLEVVELGEDAPACVVNDFDNDPDRLRAVLPAGDYLVIVDDDDFGDPGVFQLRLDLFPEGFPPLPICSEPAAFALPGVGESTTVTVNPGDLGAVSNDIEYGFCAGDPDGGEVAFAFIPAADVTVTFSTASDEPADDGLIFDSVVSVFEGVCQEGVEPLACDDDGGEGLDSTLTVDLDAGVEYIVVVDSFADTDLDGNITRQPTVPTVLTISVAARAP